MKKRGAHREGALVGADLTSLRTRWTVLVVLCGSFFLGLWLIATDRASEHAYLEREQARLEAVASSAAVVIDGERLAEEGTSRAELERLAVRLAASQGLTASVSVLARGSGDSLEVVAASLPVKGERPLTTLTGDPELEGLCAGEAALVARVVDGHLVAFAPIRTREHRVAGLVRVEGSLDRPELDRGLSRAGLSVVGLLLLFVLTRATDRFAARHVSTLERIARGEGAQSLGRFASREVVALAQALGGGGVVVNAPAAAAPAPARRARTTGTTPPPECSGLSPLALAEAVAAPHRERAARNGTALTVRCGLGVPESVDLDAETLRQALDGILATAVRTTRGGTIGVRVSHDESVQGTRCLRYDVVDSGAGLSLAERRDLTARLAAAARRGQAGIDLADDDALARAAHAAARMDGELAFESQQGSGTRVWLRVPLG